LLSVWYRGLVMSAPNPSHHACNRFCGQSGSAKDPGTIGQRMGPVDLPSLGGKAEGSGTDAEELRGLRQIHPAL
jgi:hypothetical protein